MRREIFLVVVLSPTFSDIEVVALSITAEAFSIDSENYLFNRLNTECPGAIANLITRRQFNQRRKQTRGLGEEIRQAIAKAIDGGESVFRRQGILERSDTARSL